eukprot:TRINITY_DN57092_c0_g1_i1.p1 TRINITY_DN57092_c0_g1~~TRINITY_DN57092_c0_g1_i1.p1  ORF type:complete len:446 (-),score=63.39 TRINITY_DN57092_c0_g1_i1:104-1441(-)
MNGSAGAVLEPAPKRRRMTLDWATKMGSLASVKTATSHETEKLSLEGSGVNGNDFSSYLHTVSNCTSTSTGDEGSSGSALVTCDDLLHCSPCVALTGATSEKDALWPRIALATCTRGWAASRLREWIFWHLCQGVVLILLRWEGPMDAEQKAALKGPVDRGEVILARKVSGSQSSGFFAVMGRQVQFIHNCLSTAKEHGCDFMIHLDDDEILFPLDDGLTIADLFKQHFKGGKRCIHFKNLEAVFPFEESTERPLTRSATLFRKQRQVLYCNGKSAANLRLFADGVFCSGVHHFCKYNRSHSPASPEYGLHDHDNGCVHPDCCIVEPRAVVLHFDSPSMAEWRTKFSVRAASRLTESDDAELSIFPFKRDSIDVLRKPELKSAAGQRRRLQAVYRRWRCLPGRPTEDFHESITGDVVEQRFRARLLLVRAVRTNEHVVRTLFRRD